VGFAAVQSVLLQLLTTAANLLTGVITARALGASGRGLYAASTTWPAVLGMVAVAGSSTAVLVQLRRQPQTATASVALGGLVALALSTLLVAIAFFFMPLLLGEHYRAAMHTASAGLVLTHLVALGAVSRQVFAGRGKFLLSNLAGFLPHLFHAIAILAFLVAGALTVETAVVALILGSAGSLVVLAPFLIREARGPLVAVRRVGAELWDFGRRAAPADLLAICAGWSDRLLLILLLTPEQLGLYAVAFSFSRVVTVVTPATGIMLSAMAEGGLHQAKRLHDVALRFSLVLLSLLLVVVFLLDSRLVRLVYGAQFLPAVGVFKILVVQAVAARLAAVSAQFYLASNRPALNSWFSLLDVVVSAGAMLLFAPAYGAHGAALGLLAGTAVRLGLLWTGLVVHLRLPFPRLWLTFADFRAAGTLFKP
jgi:O-antigen/teichoic acid export membrane protein